MKLVIYLINNKTTINMKHVQRPERMNEGSDEHAQY